MRTKSLSHKGKIFIFSSLRRAQYVCMYVTTFTYLAKLLRIIIRIHVRYYQSITCKININGVFIHYSLF